MAQEKITVLKWSYIGNKKETGRLKDLDHCFFKYIRIEFRDGREIFCLLHEVNIEDHTLDVFLEESETEELHKIPISDILKAEQLTMKDLYKRFRKIFVPIISTVE